jgi:hypothetical protein
MVPIGQEAWNQATISMYHGFYKRVLALQIFYVKLRQTKAFAPTLVQT